MSDSPIRVNVSARKLLNSSFEKYENQQGILTREKAVNVGLGSTSKMKAATGYKLQDAVLWNQCMLVAAICSVCRKSDSRLQLYERNSDRDGLAECLVMKCELCQHETLLHTSKRLGGRGGGAFEVNRRSVISSHQFGRVGLSNFCAGMNLPPPVTKKAYNDHLIQIEKVATKNAETQMQEAAQRLIAKVAAEKPSDIEQDNGERIANVAVTIDGTWQKRGHSSKVGVVFAIAVLTGEILDFCVKSLVCHGCKAHDSMDKESDNYKAWKESHAPNCQINHHGSSEEMESVPAIEIFSRSIQTRRLKYTTGLLDMEIAAVTAKSGRQ